MEQELITSEPIDSFNTSIAVKVRDVRVSYGPRISRTIVLDNVNATIPIGGIYGLLGPSGCGKTSLLKCIMGCRNPDNGHISIFGHPSGSPESGVPGVGVGYMPQDIALHDDLTIEEMLIYFGNLYLMPMNILAQQINLLTKLFDLPDKKQLIGTLSGGQRRRASFMCALLHRPRLLILDEPTVGVDPALRERIWNFLVGLTVNQRTTVIITTHYIEECRRGNLVGFMSKGQILIEGSPSDLLKRYNSKTLEDVFFRICLNKTQRELKTDCSDQQGEPTAIVTSSHCRRTSNRAINEIPCDSNGDIKMTHLRRTNSNNNLELSHVNDNKSKCENLMSENNNNSALVEVCQRKVPKLAHFSQYKSCDLESYDSSSSPSPSSSSSSSSFTSPSPKIPQESYDEWFIRFRCLVWRQLIQNVRRPEPTIGRVIVPLLVVITYCACIGGTPQGLGMAVINHENCSALEPGHPCLSKRLLHEFNSFVFNKIPYESVEQAIADVKTRQLWGYMEIGANFSKAIILKHRFADKAFNSVANDSIVKIHGDYTGKILMVTVEVTINDIYQNFIFEALRDYGYNPFVGQLPIRLEKTIFGEKQKVDYLGVRGFGGPGLVVIITYSVSCSIMVLVVVADKTDGMFERNYAAGVSIGQIIMSHVTTQFLFSSITTSIIFVLCIYLLDIPCKGSLAESLCLLLLQCLAGIETGLMVASAIGSLSACAVICNAILLASFTLSGVLWTNATLPYYIKWATIYLPATLPSEGMRTIMTRGLPGSSPVAFQGFLVSIAWIIVLHLGSYKVLAFVKR